MRLLSRKRRAQVGLAGVTIAGVLLGMGVHFGTAAPPAGNEGNLVAWHARMVESSKPAKPGCFAGVYPEVVWRKTECVDPPSVPMSPKRLPSAPRDVGNGASIVTERPEEAGDITHAYGTFEEVRHPELLKVDSSPANGAGPVMANSYSLQLNTNYLKVEECAGSPTPALCAGWKQFVFANDGTEQDGDNDPPGPSRLYIEYWLVGFNPDPSTGQGCPDGWAPVQDVNDVHCSLKREAGQVVHVPISNIAKPSFRIDAMTETVDGRVIDKVVFNNGDGRIYSATGVDVLHVVPGEPVPNRPGPGWTQVEFNVFGYGDGATAIFNQEANFNLRTTIVDGSPKRPACQEYGYSKESNNLNFGHPYPTPTSPAPALLVNEAHQARAPAACQVAVAIGDTHQATFGGTFYDFQASGDFVEARSGSTFEVQTRKESGAPSWPDASVDKSIGVRMGNTRVAVCDGTRLVVNGADTNLPSGESLLLSTGVTIDRLAEVYTIKDPAGNTVRTTAIEGKTRYVDLGIGLGPEATDVRGLLGNYNGDPNFLEASDGTPMEVPLSFEDLYGKFANGWRVSPSASLLRPCDAVAAGKPTAPFYAGDLPPAERNEARDYCQAIGVAPWWLDTCSLDVVVLGEQAADAYLGLQQPVVNANPEQPPPSTGPPPGSFGCRIYYQPGSATTGAGSEVTIINTGGSTLNGWVLSFSLAPGQQIVGSWNAVVTQNGTAVTARNAPHNGTIAPGAAVTFGYRHVGGNQPPTGWTLNGSACTT